MFERRYPEPASGLSYVKKLALGFSHSMALTHHGRVYVWGSNQNGCLGIGKKGSVMKEPHKLELPGGEEAVDISCGWKHSAVVTSQGNLLTWGWGGSMGTSSVHDAGGQLGHDNVFDYWEPHPTRRPSAGSRTLAAISVSCGFNHTAAIYE